MPEISRFLGMVIAMYFKDHVPPHFHVKYGEYRASIAIDTLETTEGSLPKKAMNLVVEWALEHRNELMDNWKKAIKGEMLTKIEPLA